VSQDSLVSIVLITRSSLLPIRFGSYFIEPIVAGLSKGTNKPFIASTDVIGCINFAKDFVVCGTATDKLFGVAESLWEPDLVRSLVEVKLALLRH